MRSHEKNFTIQKNLYKVDVLINRRLQAVFEPEKYISKTFIGNTHQHNTFRKTMCHNDRYRTAILRKREILPLEI